MIHKGSDLMSEYPVSKYTTCYFCSCCGTRVYSIDNRYDNVGLLRGTITSDVEVMPARQWFWDKKVDWLESLSQVKKFTGKNAEPVDDMN